MHWQRAWLSGRSRRVAQSVVTFGRIRAGLRFVQDDPQPPAGRIKALLRFVNRDVQPHDGNRHLDIAPSLGQGRLGGDLVNPRSLLDESNRASPQLGVGGLELGHQWRINMGAPGGVQDEDIITSTLCRSMRAVGNGEALPSGYWVDGRSTGSPS